MRELAGKGCICLIALIFGAFAANELLWSISVPKWTGVLFGLVVAFAIARFLLSEDKNTL